MSSPVLDLFTPPFDPAHHRALQREADRMRRCWRSTDAGHNRVAVCLCAACTYEREMTGVEYLAGRAS